MTQAITLAAILAALVASIAAGAGKPVRHDCSLAEISPDIPTAARQACRAARQGGHHAPR